MKIQCTDHDKPWCGDCEHREPHEPKWSVFVNRRMCDGEWVCIDFDGDHHPVRCEECQVLKPGFLHNGRRIFFMEPRGKDISYERWRVTLYYARNFAETHFLPSHEEYDSFLQKHVGVCYERFDYFLRDLKQGKG